MPWTFQQNGTAPTLITAINTFRATVSAQDLTYYDQVMNGVKNQLAQPTYQNWNGIIRAYVHGVFDGASTRNETQLDLGYVDPAGNFTYLI